MKIFLSRTTLIISAGALLGLQLAQAGHGSGDAGQSPSASQHKNNRPVETRELSKQELDRLLVRIEKELGTIKSLKTDFVQEKHLSIFSEVIRAKGICLFRSPDMVRFEISEPFQSALVARAKKVAKFESVKGKWQKLRLPSRDIVLRVTRQITTWLRGQFHDKDGIYNVSATVGKNTTIVLTPRDERFRKMIAAIELTLMANGKHISSVKIIEPGGDFTVMKFANQQRDIELPDEIFSTSGSAPTKIKLPEKTSAGSGEAKTKSENNKRSGKDKSD
jgi:outer membrane lipoprotein-sorting protein